MNGPTKQFGTRTLCIGTLDLDAGTVSRADTVLSLTRLELKMLRYLDAHCEQLITAEPLHPAVWGYASQVLSPINL